LSQRVIDEPLAEERSEEECKNDDRHRAADVLGEGELPAEQEGKEDAELEDEVSAGDLECHGRGERGALAEQRAR
jgi:hypothetical protein